MGQFLNPGKESYLEAVNSQIYIDKSEMIAYLNTLVKTKQKYVSVSRPRRFGKTMAVDMICAYYDREADSRELFSNLKLADANGEFGNLAWDAYLGKFDVLRIVMTKFTRNKNNFDEALDAMQKLVSREIKKKYPNVDYFDSEDMIQTIEDVYAETGQQFIIVIDEWDAVFREFPFDKEGQENYLNYLRDLFKDKSYIALAYMTGILPIKKYGKHSALNMFTEYSMMFPRQLAKYTGFTKAEVMDLCKSYGRDYETIKEWYDGYEVSDVIPPDPNHEELKATGKTLEGIKHSLYSPLSVVEAVGTGLVKDYWNKTETYEALADYIVKDYDGLKEAVTLLMDGARLHVDTSTYQNDMTTFTSKDDVLSLLIHLGYLGYDDAASEVYIPNKEILDEFKTSTKGSEWVGSFKAFEVSQELLKATWDKDSIKVAELIEQVHDLTGNKTYNDESALSYAIQYAYYAAQKYYTMILELDTGKGYADIAFIPSPLYPNKPAMVVELKYNKDVETALSQIKRRNYPSRLEHYKGNILLVGINYDRDVPSTSEGFKHHSCIIETV
ncbi:PD-(D/E)XK nuclease superfamily protein [Butyrivibrio proteoclasticus]|uniref:PD-(D/E)XK nuclease superfamily protein n=1 Tax=Butyrivibrio proteoclasticus TaxID=43305 RepID=A0A1I5VAP9_9FIRM|nr:AAA family ATPase [Butyrivibrio proteoclasticus]SFQ04417.1 PD-(D/E)XK nuclease superfamily protein [Butyrivibrio proteoclasticus]